MVMGYFRSDIQLVVCESDALKYGLYCPDSGYLAQQRHSAPQRRQTTGFLDKLRLKRLLRFVNEKSVVGLK